MTFTFLFLTCAQLTLTPQTLEVRYRGKIIKRKIWGKVGIQKVSCVVKKITPLKLYGENDHIIFFILCSRARSNIPELEQIEVESLRCICKASSIPCH